MPVQVNASQSTTPEVAETPFLRIPPFPGASVSRFAIGDSAADQRYALEDVADLIRERRVGGTFWAAQPELPDEYVLVSTSASLPAARAMAGELPIVLWVRTGPQPVPNQARTVVTGACDPWHMLAGARAFVVDRIDEDAVVAALLGVPIYRLGSDGDLAPETLDPATLNALLPHSASSDPFSGEPIGIREAIELCGFWRKLIDANREIAGGLGFAFWKRDNVGALLWGGSEPFHFARLVSDLKGSSRPVAVWRSKVSDDVLADLESQDRPLVEVEDGFLRSKGLGANCVPPLSITVDRLGAYFDPAQPSELEVQLQDGAFDKAIVERAAYLRDVIVASGLSKYGCGGEVVNRRHDSRRHILVPGQVEDDRSVQTGGCGLLTNLDLLARVREQAPDAYILYKPHPDVVAGHRKGSIPDRDSLQYADEVVCEPSITSLIAMIDEVHVNTSLAGFEALMRQKQVTTYGVPFYAGWGLTRDLGPVPARRTAERSLDELVAATLLLYPRYLDPSTGLPCPPEVIVERLSAREATDDGLVVTMRRLQGKLVRSVRSLVQ